MFVNKLFTYLTFSKTKICFNVKSSTYSFSKKLGDFRIYISVPLIRREKKNFFNNISTHEITDNKTFWKTVKPLFTEKIQTKSKIILIEKKVVSGVDQEQIISEKVISEDQAVAEVFNKFFINILQNLKIPTNPNYDTDFLVTNDQVANALNKFRNHPRIIMIKNKRKAHQCLFYGLVTYEYILKKTNNLDTVKASRQSDVPTKILNKTQAISLDTFVEISTSAFQNQMFPPDLKLADVTPVYKNKSKNSKDNYKPVSILSNISKTYERCLYNQIQDFFFYSGQISVRVSKRLQCTTLLDNSN